MYGLFLLCRLWCGSTQFDLQLHERQSEMDVRQTQLQENGGHFETFEQTTL